MTYFQEEKADSMGAKIEDDTQAKKEEIETEPPEKKVKVSNSQVMRWLKYFHFGCPNFLLSLLK